MKHALGWAIVVLFCTIGTAYAEKAVTRYALHLYASPYFDADTTIELKKHTAVTVVNRKGAWMQVEVNQSRGWLRLHQIRLGDGKRKRKSGFTGLSYLLNVSQTGRSGARGITATTGIRGLDADDLTNAKPDKQALEQLASMAASPQSAREFAQKSGLVTASVPHLPNKKTNDFPEDES